jgi:hypothetical protein
MSYGTKKMKPDMHFLLLSKVPVNEPPPDSPTGPLWRELPFYGAFLHTCQFSHKNFPESKIFPSLKTLRK